MNFKYFLYSTIIAFIGAHFKSLSICLFILLVFNIIDYITGICASKFRNEHISSYKGYKGIVKKVSMYLLLIVCFGLDIVIKFNLTEIGVKSNINNVVTLIVCTWLVFNESISIFENLNDIGTPMPKFLKPFVSKLASKVNEVGEDENS